MAKELETDIANCHLESYAITAVVTVITHIHDNPTALANEKGETRQRNWGRHKSKEVYLLLHYELH